MGDHKEPQLVIGFDVSVRDVVNLLEHVQVAGYILNIHGEFVRNPFRIITVTGLQVEPEIGLILQLKGPAAVAHFIAAHSAGFQIDGCVSFAPRVSSPQIKA